MEELERQQNCQVAEVVEFVPALGWAWAPLCIIVMCVFTGEIEVCKMPHSVKSSTKVRWNPVAV